MEALIPQPALPPQTPKSEARREGGGGARGAGQGAQGMPGAGSRGRDRGDGGKEEDFDVVLQNKAPTVPLHRTSLASESNPLARHGYQLKEIAAHHHTRVRPQLKSIVQMSIVLVLILHCYNRDC